MSSHHIVREKQEPALLALGLDNFSEELLGQLLEWSPTVITTTTTAEKINAYGIKVDMVITDEPEVALQSDLKLIPPGQDSETEAALKFLISGGYPSVNVVTDDFQLKDFLFYADKINLVIFCNGQKIFPVTSGFSKWKPAGETIYLLSNPTDLHLSGLTYTGDNQYTTSHDGFFTLQFDQLFLFIAEEI